MDSNSITRASSAGYRLPDRSNGSRSTWSRPTADRERHDKPRAAQNPDQVDPNKKDQMWKDYVLAERRAVLEWEKNWGFLRRYDQLGRLKKEESLPISVSLLPKTTNQVHGSRLSTPLEKELVRLDMLTSV